MNRKTRFVLPLKIISCILSFTLIFQTVQISVSALTINEVTEESNEADSPSADINDGGAFAEDKTEEAVIIAEDISKREETVKHFMMSDGTVVAAQYDRPVHFLKDNNYVDYDNTLIEVDGNDASDIVSENEETEEVADESWVQSFGNEKPEENETALFASAKGASNKELTNRCADFSVRFSKKSNGKKLVRFEKDGYKISWYYIGGAKTDAEIISAPADDGDPSTLERLTSSVVYKNVFSCTDIEYAVSSDGIKENIILNKDSAPAEFSVEYRANGLTPIAESDKKIVLRNEAGENVIVLYAPYMTDANGEVSTDVSLTATETGNGKFVLKTELDTDWLKAKDRVFPVTVDPLMQTEQLWTSTTQAHSAYIASDTPNSCYGRGGNSYEGCVYVGKEPDRGKTRALIKCPSLPSLKTADKVVHAELAMYSYACYPEVRAELHRVTSAWDQSTVCWNTGVTYDPSIADYQIIQYMETNASGKDRWQRFEITELVKGWYSNEYANNGVILISPSENSSDKLNRAMFFANGYPDSTSIRPFLLISYRNMSGYEDYWSFTSMTAGRGGTASINNYNGNFIFTQPLTNDNGGLLMPVNIALVFNSNQKEYKTTGFGTSMYLNYDIQLYRETDNSSLVDNGYRYYLRDADGTQHWFRFENSSDTKAKDEDGLGYTLDLYPSINTAWYSVTDKDGTVMYFDADKKLVRIIDRQGNAANLTYETVSGIKRIKTITDGAGRVYSFGYDSSGRCTQITDPAYVVTAIEYKNANNNYYITNIRFQYGTAEEQYINLNYDGSFVNQIIGVDKTIVRSSYDVSNTQYRANSLRFFGTDNTELERYTLSYQQNETTVTDKFGKTVTYQFNDFGQTTGIVDNDEKTANYYRWNGGNSTSPNANKLLAESKVISSASNLVKNPGFIRNYTDGFAYWNQNTNGTKTAEIDTAKGALTKNSIKLTKTNDTAGLSLLYQQFNDLVPNEAYTASAYVNTGGKTLTGDGILFAVELWPNGVNSGKVFCEKITSTGTNEWTRVSVTFIAPENGFARVLCGHRETSTGTAWFDDIQLEKGYGVSSYNMTENSAFTNGATAWSGGSRETAAANLLSGFNAYYHIKGDASKANQLMYNKTDVYNGKKNDVYSFGAWVKADSAPVNNIRGNDSCQPKFCVVLQFYDSTGASVGSKTLDVNCDVTSWQFVAGEAIAPKDYGSVRIETNYGNNVNDVYTVGAFVYREEFGQTYAYDDNGNLKSAKEIGTSQSSFAYNGNRLAKMLNPSGSKYYYSYNENNTLANAVSTDGIGYDFTYDAKGNATAALMKSFKYAAALSTGIEYYIRNAESGNCLDTTQNDYVRNYRFKNGKAGQKWTLVATDETGVYYLRSPEHGGWNLKVSGGVNDENRALVAEDGTGNNYKFKMQSNGDGTFRILTKVSGYARCADGQSGSSTNYDDGGIIRQTTYSASDTSQRWYFYPVEQDDDTVIETSATYTANKNFTKTVTDAAGGVTTYFNNTASGVLTSVRDPLSNVTSYTYDKSNRVTQTTGPVMSGNAAQSYVKYSYSQDRLTQIDANGLVQYNFAYDKFGRSTSVSVGNGSSSRTLASYSYNAKSLPEKITYGNGTVKTNTYNSLDKLTAVSYNNFKSAVMKHRRKRLRRLESYCFPFKNIETINPSR